MNNQSMEMCSHHVLHLLPDFFSTPGRMAFSCGAIVVFSFLLLYTWVIHVASMVIASSKVKDARKNAVDYACSTVEKAEECVRAQEPSTALPSPVSVVISPINEPNQKDSSCQPLFVEESAPANSAMEAAVSKKSRTIGFKRFDTLLPYNKDATPASLLERSTRQTAKKLKDALETEAAQRLAECGIDVPVKRILTLTPEGRLELKLMTAYVQRQYLQSLNLAKANLCFKCKKTAARAICTQCRCALYCSKQCQFADWKKRHYKQCFVLARLKTFIVY